MPELHVLRVFVASDGSHGNPLGVFVDGKQIAPGDRQAVAEDLGFSETVFIDDVRHARLQIFTPGAELPFAGHPLVGTAWLLAHLGHATEVLRPPAGEVPTWTEGPSTWIRARPEYVPHFDLVQLGEPAQVEALTGAPDGMHDAYCWAWEDEVEGRVRSRCFVPGFGIAEDPATGAAAAQMALVQRRPLLIRQGTGSILMARSSQYGDAEVGGLVVLDEEGDYHLD